MTRSYFVENITTWRELLEFCSDNDLGTCRDIMTEDERDEDVDNSISEYVSQNGWRVLLEVLDNIPCGYYFRKTGDLQYDSLDDDDFENYKDDVLYDADYDEIWDEEAEEEEETEAETENEEPDPEDSSPLEAESIAIADVIGSAAEMWQDYVDSSASTSESDENNDPDVSNEDDESEEELECPDESEFNESFKEFLGV